MNKSKNFKVALLSGESNEWCEKIMPLLLAQTDCLIVVETVDDLLSLPSTTKPEIIFICHQPENQNGILAAEQIRVLYAVTPLVVLAAEDIETLKTSLAVGALAVLPPPFAETTFVPAFNRCGHVVQALRQEALKQQSRTREELYITKVQSEQAQLCLALQAARDCLTLAPDSKVSTELLQFTTPDCQAPLVQDVFSLHTLLQSVTGAATVTIADYLPKHFRGDATRLGYALQAVISGSSRFGETTPTITLAIKERTPAGMTFQFNIRVENGCIAGESCQSIRDYLVTADIPLATQGLGLAATLMEQMNGTLLIRNERGGARTVSCSVPLLSETVASHSGIALELEDAPPPLPSLKVLVAEDNLVEQITLKLLLEAIGCQVIIVGNGKEAVDECAHGEFDLVLMDILMPVMDGFDATRLIREREQVTGGKIPVVALTSYSLKAIQEECIRVGMNGCLAKPVAKNKLLEALQRLGKQQKLSNKSEVGCTIGI